MRLALIYWTFPKKSETFLQREAEALLNLGAEVEFYSMFGGARYFHGKKIHRIGFWRWIVELPHILFDLCAHAPIRKLLWPPRRVGAANYMENLIGIFAGIVWAEQWHKYGWVQAQWGTGPGMAALVAHQLNGVRYSIGLHAYDLYENGGDGWLLPKISAAHAIVSSNAQARDEIMRRFKIDSCFLIRRGLPARTGQPQRARQEGFGAEGPNNNPRPEGGGRRWVCINVSERNHIPLILTVGRLIPKKGFDRFIDVMDSLKKSGFQFRAIIAGDGPQWALLKRKVSELRLDDCVELPGWVEANDVLSLMEKADFFIFTGKVSDNGDRDGFPNVIAEAFYGGAVVLAMDVAGVSEGVLDSQTGILMQSTQPSVWAEKIKQLYADPLRMEALRNGARLWASEEFDASKNAGKLLSLVQKWSSGLFR